MVLESAKLDIKNFIDATKRLNTYTIYKDKLENDLMFKMEVNELTELGNLKIVETPKHKSVSVTEFEKLFLDEDLKNNIMVKIDLEKTREHLRVNLGFSESKVCGIIELLERITIEYKKELMIIEDNSDR